MREKRSWYVWLSVFGLVYLVMKAWEALGYSGAGGRAWLPYLGWAAYLLAGQFLLPAVVILESWRRIHWTRLTPCLLGLAVALLLIYGIGVLAAVRLDRTIRKYER